MILIFSQDVEPTTAAVCRWLNYYQKPWIRINRPIENNFQLELSEKKLQLNILDKNILSQVNAVWFRRSESVKLLSENKIEEDLKQGINKTILSEYRGIYESFFSSLSNKKWLNHPHFSNINKLQQLVAARASGLKIPNTIITNSKKDILSFFKKNHKKVIMKAIRDIRPFSFKDKYYSTYTKLLTETDINSFSETFMPSLFQKQIEKQFEIRTFYLRGKFYSMAMFTQQNKKTKIDFRNYDTDNPSRSVPYAIPKRFELSLKKLLMKLNLNCGSIDIIKGCDNKYYFLEVNPVGQFGMVSYPCNYNLENKVAQELIKMSENEK